MRASSRGFTLVELMVTLAVAAILLMVAVPSFAELLRSNRLSAANNGLVTALNVARAEALRRGQPVTVCASNDQNTCSDSTDWATGWVVFQDTANSGTPSPPSAGSKTAKDYEQRMISSDPAPGEGFVLNGDDQWYRFSPMGTLSWKTAGTASERDFKLRNKDCKTGTANRQRRITVNRIGRIRSAAEACS